MDTDRRDVMSFDAMPPPNQDAGTDLVGVPESRAGILTLLDYASLMRGLELLPQRRTEVLAHFELDEESGQPEIDRWTGWLATHPGDDAECTKLAERMTDYWRRWDKTTPVVAPSPDDEQKPPAPEDAPLELMAKLSAGLETLPDRRIDVFVALGFRTHDAQIDLQIALDRLKSSPDLDVKRFLALRTEATPFWQRWLSAPTLSLVDYARLVLDLERASAKDETSIYRAHRLDRVSAERELSLWKTRIDGSPEEAARYAQVREQLLRTANAPQRGPIEPARGDAPAPLPARPAPPVQRPPTHAPMTARAMANPIFTRTPAPVAAVMIAPTLPSFTGSIAATPRSPFEAAPAPAVVGAPFVAARQLTPTPATDPPPIGLLEYTILCLQLELDEARSELHYRRLGLVDQAHRDNAHAYWQARFAIDPSARQEWIDQAKRLRTNWQGSRK
jgi:hypothetical protein